MRILHTMMRVGDLERSIDFYTQVLGMKLLRRRDYPEGSFTLAFVGYGDESSTRCSSSPTTGTRSPTTSARLRPRRARGRRMLQGLRRGAAARRQGHARGRPDEARHHCHRLRRRSRRLQDRVHPDARRPEAGMPSTRRVGESHEGIDRKQSRRARQAKFQARSARFRNQSTQRISQRLAALRNARGDDLREHRLVDRPCASEPGTA